MNTITITQKATNKHLERHQIEYVINSIRDFENENKNKKRNTGKTEFMNRLAHEVGTARSNVYRIRELARVELIDSSLKPYMTYSVEAVVNRFKEGRARPNSLKIDKAGEFIDEVIGMVKKKHKGGDCRYDLTSIDEAVNSLIIDHPDRYPEGCRVCTKTVYNYVHRRLISLRPIDLPRMSSLKRSGHVNKDKLPLSKRQKGISIDQRPDISDRSEFGHWECDLVTGPRDGKRGAYFTLIERKTREYIMMPITSKSAENVLECINRLHDHFGMHFSSVFRSLTFDNGNEFALWREIETDPSNGEKRTSVYFAHPYCSYERGSNENCNGLIRRFIKKGTDVNKISKDITMKINKCINSKRRKILQYVSSESLFINNLVQLGIPASKANFYEVI